MLEENTMMAFKPAHEMIITDLETLKVLADPLRLSIIEYLSRPGTVKKIAEKLDKPPTKLYYHFNLLEKHGLITLVDTRIVSGIIEKHYQASARSYRLQRGLLSPGSEEPGQGLDITLSSLFADSRNDLMQSIRDGVVKLDEDSADIERLLLIQYRLLLDSGQLHEFLQRLRGLLREYQDVSDRNAAQNDTITYKGLIVSYPSSRLLDDEG
ncbi:MAG: helix-turn-helix domain-containing protein [Anaerolineae bacterium]|jgi:DNA-binding transcriptional ArsR family regulator|nr:helix-turn-helix domain-containing protein [Anaerolineae bacterium]